MLVTSCLRKNLDSEGVLYLLWDITKANVNVSIYMSVRCLAHF